MCSRHLTSSTALNVGILQHSHLLHYWMDAPAPALGIHVSWLVMGFLRSHCQLPLTDREASSE